MKLTIIILTIVIIKCYSAQVPDIELCPVHDCPQDTFCPNGFATNEKGCLTCDCLPFHTSCAAISCPFNSECKEIVSGCENPPPDQPCDPVVTYKCVPICLDLKCRECVSGNVIDKRGCRTCACKDPCEGVNCPIGQACVKSKGPNRFKCEFIKQCQCPKGRDLQVSKPANCLNVCIIACKQGFTCCPDIFGCVSCKRCRN